MITTECRKTAVIELPPYQENIQDLFLTIEIESVLDCCNVAIVKHSYYYSKQKKNTHAAPVLRQNMPDIYANIRLQLFFFSLCLDLFCFRHID